MLLDKQTELTFDLLEERKIEKDKIAIGFLDESRPQNTPNTVRGWRLD